MKNKHVILIALLAGGLTLVQAQDGTIVQGNNLADKLEWLNVFSQSNTSYIIEVRANENQDIRLSYSGKNNITITLRGIGANRTINGYFTVGSGVTLILDSTITLSLSGSVNGDGSVIMNNGATIRAEGYREVSVGSFTMNGGTISGVQMSVGSFTMNDGTISGNTASYGGGVFVGAGVTFTKTGGTIYGYSASDTANSNTVKNESGAVQNFRGHAVYAGSSETLLKIREGTAGPEDIMTYDGTQIPPAASGSWDN